MMTKKKKFLIAAISVVCVAAILATSLGVYYGMYHYSVYYGRYTPYDEAQRKILSTRFDEVNLSGGGVKRMTIDRENPVNLITYYGDADGVEKLWNALDEEVRRYSVILIIAGNFLAPSNGDALGKLNRTMDECEEKAIPFGVQLLNGETHREWLPPLKFAEDILKNYSHCRGFNAAELYNAGEWKGALDGDFSGYVADIVRLCHTYGAYWFWTDTNIFGKNGTLIDWIENNEYLYETLSLFGECVIMQNKESYGDPSTYSVMLGLYLSGLIGGWGVATDDWHWQVSDYRTLFGYKDSLIDSEWERIMNYPEAMQAQSLMLVASYGGFAFKNEAQFLTVAAEGEITAGFQYAILPFLKKTISGEFPVATKADVLEKVRFAVVGGENYSAINYNAKQSKLYPATGKYGIIPLLPKNLGNREREIFTDYKIALIEEKLTLGNASPYADASVEGDTFTSKVGDTLYYLNNVENSDIIKTSLASGFRFVDIEKVSVTSAPHTFLMAKESSGKLKFYLNNYRTDKDIFNRNVTSIETAEDAERLMNEYFGLDENGNPKRVSHSAKRTTTVKIIAGDSDVSVRFLTPSEGGATSRPYSYTQTLENGIITLTIEHNGEVEFEVTAGTRELAAQAKPDVENAESAVNTEYDFDALAETIAGSEEILSNKFSYFEASFENFQNAYLKAKRAAAERVCSSERAEELKAAFIEAKSLLIDVSEVKAVLKNFDEKSGKNYDLLLRAVTSPTVYLEGKENKLTLRKHDKKTVYDGKIFKAKSKEIEKRMKAF